MKIILLQDIRKLGRKRDIKEVSDGYARNFLFPNKLAEPATPSALKKLSAAKSEMDKNEAELVKRLKEIKRKMDGTSLEFRVKTDKSGAVFGSVTKETILAGLRDTELVTKEHVEIKLDRPIKELGEHTVDVDLKKGIEAKLKIILKAEK